MIVLIANINREAILKYFKRAKFTPSTANTSTFRTSQKTFARVFVQLQKEGINPYAFMSW